MKVLGITGGIGMGKSAVSTLLEKRNVSVVDTDHLARKVVEPGQPALEEVQALFGTGVIGADGRLQRQELARRVFGSAVSRKQLEAILHPRIRALWLKQIEEWREAGEGAGAIVIPLLFETKAQKHFDAVVCIASSAETQKKRLLERKMTEEQINQRIKAQLPIAKKMELADYVIWNEGTLEETGLQLNEVLMSVGVLE
tara:strand:+ start:2709 stop:3305 length:597 start_codon:yes stop_codon:yes gene_type:complete